jgi:CHRD domain-containing protein
MEGTMRRLGILMGILAMGVAGCGSKSSSTAPTNAPTVFTVSLNPANEVPPVTNAESSARGTAIITITTTKDASGAITAGTINFNVSLNSFPSSTTTLSAAHIHNGAAGVAAGVFVSAGLTSGSIAVTNGNASFNLDVSSATADQINQILANPAGFYFNVHTPANPGGVMRGQLK